MEDTSRPLVVPAGQSGIDDAIAWANYLFVSLADALIANGSIARYELVDALTGRQEQMGVPPEYIALIDAIKADLLSGVEEIPVPDKGQR